MRVDAGFEAIAEAVSTGSPAAGKPRPAPGAAAAQRGSAREGRWGTGGCCQCARVSTHQMIAAAPRATIPAPSMTSATRKCVWMESMSLLLQVPVEAR